jgi:RimJ/RimL family protein N-acetyltransferase
MAANDRRSLGAAIPLQGERCVLRRWHAEDVGALASLANDPDVARYMGAMPHPYTSEDARWWISTGSLHNGHINFAITLEGAPIGGIGLTLGAGPRRGTAMAGYWLGRAYWGQGLATDALRTLTGFALAELGLVRLWAFVMSPNLASARVLEKAGYVREATLRSAIVDREGNVHDEIIFVRLPALAPAGCPSPDALEFDRLERDQSVGDHRAKRGEDLVDVLHAIDHFDQDR